MFKDHAPKYYDKNLPVIPLNGKIPLIKEWQKFCTQKMDDDFFEMLCNTYQNANIGLCLGPISKIVAIDIDIDDIPNFIPQSPIVKKGKKGETRFFKYNGETPFKKHPIELLSIGNQTVLPPSIHPETKKPYIFTNFFGEFDELPVIPQSFFNAMKVCNIVAPLKTSGRNNKLVEVVTAKLTDGKNVNQVIIETLQFDKDNHSPALFEDSAEKIKGNSPQQKCFNFVMNISNSLMEKGLLKIQEEKKFSIVQDLPIIEKEDLKEIKFPQFRGVAQDLFEHVYSIMPVKRTRYAIASTLACLSTVCGNRVCALGKYTNLYLLIIGPSGSGKDAPLRFPTSFFAEFDKTLSGGAPESDSGILLGLDKKQTRLDVFDEAGKLFGLMNDSKNLYASKMADQYATLFTSTGYHFAGKTLKNGVLGECFSPCVSIIGALTINDFQNTFNTNLIAKGLGARFLFFPDTEFKKITVSKKSKKIPTSIVAWAKKIRKVQPDESDIIVKANELEVNDDVAEFYEIIINKYREQYKDDEMLAPIFNRAGEIITKLALIDEMSQNPDATLLTIDSVNWAIKWFDAYADSLIKFLPKNISQENMSDFKIQNMIMEEIKKAGINGITKKHLTQSYIIKKRLGLNSRKLDSILHTLLECEVIYKKIIRDNDRPTTIFFHENFVAF